MSENAYWDIRNTLTDLVCKTCHGSGKCDDAEPGDIGFNEWQCPDCDGNGFANGFAFRLENACLDTQTILNAAYEVAAILVEKKERDIFDRVGNPQITSFTPYMANAIRTLKS